MLSKITYAVQPYQVGHKDRKSLAIIIPAKIARECEVNTSTIFAIHTDKQKKSLTLHMLDIPYQKSAMILTGRTL
jgi:hypothetical protein